MKKQNHKRKCKTLYYMITIFFLALSCSLIFSSLAFATDKIHLDKVPYVVQKERLD